MNRDLKSVYSLKMDIGTRDEQQDYAAVCTNNGMLMAVVCDGMGGLECGAEASRVAALSLIEEFKKITDEKQIPGMFENSIDIMDENVMTVSEKGGKTSAAGTTVVSVVLSSRNLFWASVGDSRLYILRAGEFIQATRDHNYGMILNSAEVSREPTEKELQNYDALVSYIGMGGIDFMDISQEAFELFENDILLLTTDGLFKSLSDEEIKNILETEPDVNSMAESLILTAEKQSCSSRDNTTFIIIKTEGLE